MSDRAERSAPSSDSPDQRPPGGKSILEVLRLASITAVAGFLTLPSLAQRSIIGEGFEEPRQIVMSGVE
jgi:hypothetical protein